MNEYPSIMKQICSQGSSKNTFWEWFWFFFEMIEWEKWWWWSDFNPVSYSIKGLKVLNFAVLISYWTICDKVIPMKGGQHERGKHVARFKIKVRTSCQLNHQPITQKTLPQQIFQILTPLIEKLENGHRFCEVIVSGAIVIYLK